jgi:hypothetical protein
VREHVLDLVHQVDPEVGILDPDMDMHPTDDELSGHLLVVGRQVGVAGLLRGLLLRPIGERMGGGGNDRRSVLTHHGR